MVKLSVSINQRPSNHWVTNWESVMRITIEVRDVYGTTKFYPICDRAKLFASIAGTKTLTNDAIKQIKALGYEVELKSKEVVL
mgnify:CR=1 FL=1